MKIEGPGSPRPGQVRKTQRSGTGAEFLRHLGDEGDGDVRKTAPGSGIVALNPLIALQEVDDALNGRRQARQRADDILDRLEELRLGLLAGSFPRDRLLDLVRLVQSRRAAVDDPKLQAVLDEIDLRAQVEIAKLGP